MQEVIVNDSFPKSDKFPGNESVQRCQSSMSKQSKYCVHSGKETRLKGNVAILYIKVCVQVLVSAAAYVGKVVEAV